MNESVYCKCGHHIADHYSTVSLLSLHQGTNAEPLYKCQRCEQLLEGTKSFDFESCTGFVPYDLELKTAETKLEHNKWIDRNKLE